MIRTFSMGMMYRINYFIAINMFRNAISTFLRQQQSIYLRFSLIGFWFEIGQLKVMSAVMSSIAVGRNTGFLMHRSPPLFLRIANG